MIHQHLPDTTRVKRLVCQQLAWDEMQYASLQFNMGLHYLCLYLSDHEPTIKMMECSALYWNWWKAKWAKRDQMWLAQFETLPFPELYSNRSRVSDYYSLHDPEELVHKIAPTRAIIQHQKKVAV